MPKTIKTSTNKVNTKPVPAKQAKSKTVKPKATAKPKTMKLTKNGLIDGFLYYNGGEKYKVSKTNLEKFNKTVLLSKTVPSAENLVTAYEAFVNILSSIEVLTLTKRNGAGFALKHTGKRIMRNKDCYKSGGVVFTNLICTNLPEVLTVTTSTTKEKVVTGKTIEDKIFNLEFFINSTCN